jgi:hypothetical protein
MRGKHFVGIAGAVGYRDLRGGHGRVLFHAFTMPIVRLASSYLTRTPAPALPCPRNPLLAYA